MKPKILLTLAFCASTIGVSHANPNPNANPEGVKPTHASGKQEYLLQACIKNGGSASACFDAAMLGEQGHKGMARDVCEKETDPQRRAMCLALVDSESPEQTADDMVKGAARKDGVPMPTNNNLCANTNDKSACHKGLETVQRDFDENTRDEYIKNMCKAVGTSAEYQECLDGLRKLKALEAQGVPVAPPDLPDEIDPDQACAGLSGAEQGLCYKAFKTNDVDPEDYCATLSGEAQAGCVNAVRNGM